MTPLQAELTNAIDCQRLIVAQMPGDITEAALLDSLITALRDTFVIVKAENTPQYVYSPSRAVLKRVQ